MATLTASDINSLLSQLELDTPVPPFPQSDILNRPVDIYRAYLADTASKVLGSDRDLTYEALQSAANIKDNSDLTLVLPKLKLKSEKPKEIAKECLFKFSSTPLFQLPLPDGLHLRFVFATSNLPRFMLPYIGDRLSTYGNSSLGVRDAEGPIPSRQKVVVEFSSPNLAGEFRPNHLRSTIIGAQIANLFEHMGWDVVRLNYLGDWGKEVGLLAVGKDRFGSEELLQKDPMRHLLDVYDQMMELFRPEKEASKRARDEKQDTAAIENRGIFAERDTFFKRMEDGEPEAVDFWKRIRDATIDYYVKAYARFKIKFDEFSGESQVSAESIAEVESVLKEKGIYEESEGSWIIDYTKHGPRSLGISVVRGRTGSTTYLLRDIAAVLDRHKKHSFDKMIYVVASEQDMHFNKVFQALRYMGRDDLADKLEHVSFGKAQGFSQLGSVQLLGDILDQSASALRDALGAEHDHPIQIENTEAAASALGITALITQDAQSRRSTGYSFSTAKLASFEGETGPSLQACYAKLCAKIKEIDSDQATLANVDYEYLQEDWSELLGTMAQYPDITVASYKSREPSMILAYLFRLGEQLNDCLDEDGDGAPEDSAKRGEESIESQQSDPDPPEALLAQAVLYKLARQVFDNGLAVLGIPPVVA